ncbi:MAG: pyrroloquinoline quinone-dependent dehydrogenase, partial [Gemmatimonadaceae bacterium]
REAFDDEGRRRAASVAMRLVPLACAGLLAIPAAAAQPGGSGSTGARTAAAGVSDTATTGTGITSADSALRRAMADSGSWPSYGRDYTNRRFAPLTQITAANVASLRLAWKYKTGVPHAFQASPVVVDGVMYISTPLNHVIALDARTGTKRWEYVQRLGTTVFCCGPVNRGVAVYGGRVFMGTLDARLVALDARDGRKLWDVKVADPDSAFSLTGTPVVVEGRVLVGTGGAEYGRRCFVSAYDAATGRELWRFYNVPTPKDGGWWGKWAERDAFGTPLNRDIARDKRDSARFSDAWRTGGGSTWQAPAVDTARGLMIYATGNPGPDLDGRVRPGDNLYTNSIVALDYRTGKLRWYFQTLPHDRWDYDAASPVVLLDVKDSTGRMVPAVAQAGKTGWVYFVSRETGAPLRRSVNFVPHENLFAEPTLGGTRMLPGANGGSEWSPAAFSPLTNYLYVMGMNQPMIFRLRPEPLKPPAFWRAGTWIEVGAPSEHYSLFSAIDVNTGNIAWQAKLEKPTIGGMVVTAGGVVFTGTADKHFLAFDARTGAELWRYDAAAGVNAPPVSYALDGRQYVAVAAGGSFQIDSPRGDELLVFALPERSSEAGTSRDTRVATQRQP